MKRLRIPTVVFCMALVALSIIGIAVAQAAPPGPQADPTAVTSPAAIPGLDKPVEQFTEADLQRFVDLGLGHKLSKEQIDATFKRLNDAQKGIVARMVEAEGKRRLAESPAPPPTDDEARRFADPSGTLDGIAWNQLIPNSALSNDVLPNTWFTTQYTCDDNSDTDWVFVFTFDPSNPDGLGWDTYNTALYLAVLASDGGYTKAYGVTDDSYVNVCFGDITVAGAGGSYLVGSQTYVGWKN